MQLILTKMMPNNELKCNTSHITKQHNHISIKEHHLNITLCQYPTNKIKKILAKRGERRNKIANHVRINFSLRTLLKLSN